MNNEKQFLIGEALATEIGRYLMTRPMVEVELMVNGMRNMQESRPHEPAEEPEKQPKKAEK